MSFEVDDCAIVDSICKENDTVSVAKIPTSVPGQPSNNFV